MTTSPASTIVARATPAGRGGVGIVRISGTLVQAIARAVLGSCPEPRVATLYDFRDADGEALDTGLALFFPQPNSYTGEDVLELQGHGGPVLLEMIIARIVELGARIARPGEFSERAFLNDKLDLLQAEAVADLIDAGSQAAARAAQRSLSGEFSAAVLGLNEQVTGLRMYVEAAIDFPEEEIDFLGTDELRRRLDTVEQEFTRIEAAARQGRLLRDGIHVVLAGRPNSGKSSLLNRLAGYDAAIVTDQPGTTRDPIREHLEIDGLPVHIVDTAGLRDSADPVEREGVHRARAQLAVADLALLVIDATDAADISELTDKLPAGVPVIVVRNKIDLSGEAPGPDGNCGPALARISALTGAGLPGLRQLIKEQAGFGETGEGTVIARQRHLDSIRRARAHFDAGREQLEGQRAGELLAEELRGAQIALAEITGEFTSDDLLGKIFGSFCIGK
ncbi:MAG: tRNA uridine-5-carboxymethylaminomethyl(34) synthesis GTPase MnmE [Chromatiales bacterium]|jgi:tRNA modification GTPase|nr:MAG: tRNA uridine-5-carboxymethylaminomethyl(34) synthesis GTPase MnmE [Chromatiales bacterium]